MEERERCKQEIIEVIVKRLGDEEKGQLTAKYVIGVLEELSHEISEKALLKGINKIY